MSTILYLSQAQQLLELALEQARQERDRGVFELARGERSLQQLQRLVERVDSLFLRSTMPCLRRVQLQQTQ